MDITVLGDTANVAARLASEARAGEIILSDTIRRAARVQTEGMRACRLELKGRKEPIDVWAKKISANEPAI